MQSRAQLFLKKVVGTFGCVDSIREIECPNRDNPIYVFNYYNLPEQGMITSITYGFSEEDSDTENQSELIMSLHTFDEEWGVVSAFVASKIKSGKPFSFGETFLCDKPISEESDMMGYFIYQSLIIEEPEIEVEGEKIRLMGMYPIYKEEIELISKIGPDEFWKLLGFNMFNTNRDNLAK